MSNKNQKQFVYTTCSEVTIFMKQNRNSMNNLLSYCGFIYAKIRGSDKDLPLQLFNVYGEKFPTNPIYSSRNQKTY